MKKLCLGTFIKIICQAKNSSITQKHLISELFSFLEYYDKYEDESHQGHLKSGKNNYTEIDEIIAMDKNELINHFKTVIIPLLNVKLHKEIILAIRDVLSEDDVDDLTIIGFETEGYTKDDIITKVYFNLEETLANVFYYCTVLVLNIPYKENIKEIKTDYVGSFTPNIDSIQFENITKRVLSKIDSTLDKNQFDKVFYKIKVDNLENPNPNEIAIYCLDVLNACIDYRAIKEFIFDNIGNYVFSRAQRNNYNLQGKEKNITAQAIKAYNKKIITTPETNHFNEIMLYSFLECVLKASKIFSKMELQNKSGEYSTFSSGIHVITLKIGSLPFNQFVFGASNTIDSLESAVDKSFEQINEVLSSKNEEYDLLESTILNQQFDAKTNDTLYSMIVPQKGFGVKKPDKAFGIFLGYSINISSEGLSNDEYRVLIKDKMENDLIAITKYINNKITEHGLSNYSFYIYVLPLNNAFIDKDKIMHEALEV